MRVVARVVVSWCRRVGGGMVFVGDSVCCCWCCGMCVLEGIFLGLWWHAFFRMELFCRKACLVRVVH